MPVGFPANPAPGDTFQALNGVDYTYNGVAWVATGPGGGGSDTPQTAAEVPYDDTETSYGVDNVQDALEANAAADGALGVRVTQNETDIAALDADTYSKSEIDTQQAAQDAAITALDADTYSKSEIDTQQAAQDSALAALDADTYSTSEIDAQQAAQDSATQAAVAARMQWRGLWQDGTTYESQDVVREGVWTMVANKQTTATPAPRPKEQPSYILEDAPMWALEDFTSVTSVIVGVDYVAPEAFMAESARFWARPGHVYNVFYQIDGGTVSQIAGAISVNEEQWIAVTFGPLFVQTGQTVRAFMSIKPTTAGATPVVYQHNWDYSKPDDLVGGVNPGQALHTNHELNLLRVHKIDYDTNDQTTELDTISAGATISVMEQTWEVLSVVKVGDYYEFEIAPATQSYQWGTTVMSFRTTLPVDLDAVYMPDGYAALTDVSGFYTTGNLDAATTSQDAYGIELKLAAIELSADWDILAYSSGNGPPGWTGGGGGGGSGGASVVASDTPPSSPDPGDLWFRTSEPVGLYIWYDDGDSAQWVQTDGGATHSEVTIVEDDTTDNWLVVGDILLQWGTAVGGGGTADVVYPNTFATPPRVVASCVTASNRNVSVTSNTEAGVTFAMYIADTGDASSVSVFWVAIGEAPDDLKKPKVVGGSGGGGGGTDLPADAPGVLTNDGAGLLTWEDSSVGGDFLPLDGSANMLGDITFQQPNSFTTMGLNFRRENGISLVGTFSMKNGFASITTTQSNGNTGLSYYFRPDLTLLTDTDVVTRGSADARYAQSDWRNQVQITQAAYDALSPPDPDTMYVIIG